jgi:putative ABC transport system ATP-binding protein
VPVAALELVELAKTYPGDVPVHALAGVTLVIGEGEAVSIVGPSGSGKSTLLNVLGLLDRPSAGTYRVGGVDTSGLSETARTALRAHTFGFVFQSFHLLDDRDVVSNVELGMLYGGIRPRERRARAANAVRRVGLDHRAGSRPRTLSGGERQRVAIARAIAGRPTVLLCDEPTGNLDSATADGIMRLLRSLNREGLTLVVVTHDVSVARSMPRTVRVRDGQVQEVHGAAT